MNKSLIGVAGLLACVPLVGCKVRDTPRPVPHGEARVAQGPTSLAPIAGTQDGEENLYCLVLRLKSERGEIPPEEQGGRARAIAETLRSTYARLKHLSFTDEIVRYWCTEGSPESRRPMHTWKYAQSFATVSTAMTPTKARTEISIEGKRLYFVLLRDGAYSEYKSPWKGAPGEVAHYSAEENHVRCRRGVSGEILCQTGGFWRSWIGEYHAQRTAILGVQRLLSVGSWVGTATVDGESCDVVIVERTDNKDRPLLDALVVSPKGFLVYHLAVSHAEAKEYNRFIQIDRLRDIRTSPLPDTVFSIPASLLNESEGWERPGPEPEA